MKNILKNATKISFLSLIATLVVTILLICLLQFASVDSKILHEFAKVFIAIALPFLIVSPILGVIYSFFIKGKRKIFYILIHFVLMCTISLFAFMSFIFRYFVPFAP